MLEYCEEKHLIDFIKSKGLAEECEKYCELKEKEERELASKVAVGDREFHWEGHYTGCCYEMSGEHFNRTSTFNDLCVERNYIPVEYFDPSSEVKAWNTIPENEEIISLREMEEKYDVKFDKVFKYLRSFVNGNIGKGNRCYDFADFGFDVYPTDEQLKTWLEQLRFVVSSINDDVKSYDWFNDEGF